MTIGFTVLCKFCRTQQGQQKLDPVELYHMISPVSIEHIALQCDVATSQEGSNHSLDTG